MIILSAACSSFVLVSALLGYATTVIPHWFTHYVASGLFAVFGLKMLKEGRCSSLPCVLLLNPVLPCCP